MDEWIMDKDSLINSLILLRVEKNYCVIELKGPLSFSNFHLTGPLTTTVIYNNWQLAESINTTTENEFSL